MASGFGHVVVMMVMMILKSEGKVIVHHSCCAKGRSGFSVRLPGVGGRAKRIERRTIIV